MLHEGNVLACIQLVDNVSISTSTNFMIHVLIDPNDGSRYTVTDDFTDFQKAVISMATLSDEMKRQLASQKIEFEDMQLEFMDVRRIAQEAGEALEQAQEIANNALHTSQEALNTILGFENLAEEAKNSAQEAKDSAAQVTEEIQGIKDRLDADEQITEAIREVAQSAKEIAEAIQEQDCSCGVSEEELNAAIEQAKTEIAQSTDDRVAELLSIKEW